MPAGSVPRRSPTRAVPGRTRRGAAPGRACGRPAPASVPGLRSGVAGHPAGDLCRPVPVPGPGTAVPGCVATSSGTVAGAPGGGTARTCVRDRSVPDGSTAVPHRVRSDRDRLARTASSADTARSFRTVASTSVVAVPWACPTGAASVSAVAGRARARTCSQQCRPSPRAAESRGRSTSALATRAYPAPVEEVTPRA